MPRLTLSAQLLVVATLLVGGAVSAEPVTGPLPDRTEALPKPLESVEVKEHLGGAIPKTLGFLDETGHPVALGDYLDGKLPVVFTFNYSNCPMLCSLMLNGFVHGLKELDYVPGREFRVVTVSIDHHETPDHALRTQHRYLAEYGHPEAKDGWHFLTGSEANVRAYASALGLGYVYVPERKEFAHPSALVVASPSGKIVRYLYGIEYPARSLKLALLEASQGKIGTAFDRLVLYCFHYDATEGRYAPMAANIMRVGGAVSVFLLAGFLFALWRTDAKKRRHLAESTP